MKTIVKEFSKKIQNQIRKDFDSGIITKEDLFQIQEWIKIIEENGYLFMKDNKAWRDHKLYGNWVGHRSSSFSKMGRIIYKVEEGKVIVVEVKRITGGHDYEQ